MSAKDWVLGKKKAWQLRFNDAFTAKMLLPGDGKNIFRLQPVKRKGRIVYLRVTFRKDAMADCWKDVILFPRGSKPLQQTNPVLPEQPSSIEHDAAIADLRQTLTNKPFSTERLEGEFTLRTANGKEKGCVTLVQVRKALGGKQAWLAVLYDNDVGSPNGSGGGGSVHN